MVTRAAIAAYWLVWVGVSAGTVYAAVQSGLSLWQGVAIASLLFVVLNGTLAYAYRRSALKQEGKLPPPYLRYLLFGESHARPTATASRADHLIVSLIALIASVLFVFCGIGLSIAAEWSRLDHPLAAVVICLIPTGIGTVLAYVAWRTYTDSKKASMSPNNSLDGARGGS